MPNMKLNDLLIKNQTTDKNQEFIWDSSFEGRGSFGLRLSKSGSKTFVFAYRVGDNGPQRRATVGSWGKRKPHLTYKQAKMEAYAAAQKAAKGIDPFQKQLEARTAETVEEQALHRASRTQTQAADLRGRGPENIGQICLSFLEEAQGK